MKLLRPGQPTHFFFAAVILGSLVLAVDLAVTLLVPSQEVRSTFSDILGPVVDFAAVGLTFLAAKESARRSKRLGIVWGIVCLSMLFYALGDTSWGIYELILEEPPFPSIADAFYLAYYPVLLVSVLLLPDHRSTRVESINRILDTSIVMLASLLAFYNILLGPIILANEGYPWIEQAILLAYPIGDLVLLTALLLIINSRYHELDPMAAVLLACSLIITIASDFIYTYQAMLGTYQSGGLLDLGWVLEVILVGLAGAAQYTAMRAPGGPIERHSLLKYGDRFKFLRHYIPYIWLIGAFVVLVESTLTPMPMDFLSLSIGVGAVIGLVLLRQLLTLNENDKLNTELEKSVLNFQVQATKLERINMALNSEISERKRIEERLSYDSMHDSMTKLANRVLFMDRLGQALEYCKRRSEYSFAVFFVDLDQFKVINDSLGHITGDQLLVAASRRLKSCLRSSDTVARFGGDEFAVLLEVTGEEQYVTAVARKVLDAIEQPFSVNGHGLYISASIGIVLNMAGYNNPEEVLRDADIAMYQAKATGKARFEVFDIKMRSQAFSRLEVERELRTALERAEFRLHYQPILSLQTGRVTSFEALLRWKHPRRGLLMPGDFLSIAEESGLILQIGEWVLYEACAQLKRWHEQIPELRDININVNISNKQFLQPDFVSQVMAALSSQDLSPNYLKLEITENVLISNYGEADQVFTRLQALGIQLEIDDFGSGYSALGYLQHLPVTTIKIDKSFIDEIGRGGRGTELIRAIVSMARELDMETIAEGIETREQLNALKDLLCGYGQGFYLSRPLDEKSIVAFLAAQKQLTAGASLPS